MSIKQIGMVKGYCGEGKPHSDEFCRKVAGAPAK